MIVMSAERARSEPSIIARNLSLPRVNARLAQIADVATAHHVAPSKADLDFTRRVASSDPLSPLPFYILALSGDVRDPAAAIAAALQRDPRFRLGYAWQAAASAKAGDIAGATHALIRLGLLSPIDAGIWPALAQLTANPAARLVIKAELARNPGWKDPYISALTRSAVDRSIVFDIMQSAGKTPSQHAAQPDEPQDRREFISAMVQRKDYERAYLAWLQWLPAASEVATGLVFDGDFKDFAALPPFSWQITTDGTGGGVKVDPASGLMVDYFGTDGGTLTQQMLVLSSGRYRLTTNANFSAVPTVSDNPAMSWVLVCAPNLAPLSTLAVPLDGSSKRATGTVFDVPVDCPAQLLALKVAPSDVSTRLSGTVRSVDIQAVQ